MMYDTKVITSHPHYDILINSNTYYMDKISGLPIKKLTQVWDGNRYTPYKKYERNFYDEQGRIIKIMELISPLMFYINGHRPLTKKPPSKLNWKLISWNDNNEIIHYKDSLGNYYDQSWGGTSKCPYKNPMLEIDSIKDYFRIQKENFARNKEHWETIWVPTPYMPTTGLINT